MVSILLKKEEVVVILTPTATQHFAEKVMHFPKLIWGISCHLEESVAAITQLRTIVNCQMEELGIPQEDCEEVGLLIAELASNALRHARSKYQVDLELFPNQVVVRVIDSGEGFSPEDIMQPGTYRANHLGKAHEQRIGGFGLQLVAGIADELRIQRNHDRGMTVQATKQLRRSI